MAAIVGCAGLRPVMAALDGGGTVALANKEALVSAGAIVMDGAPRAHGATLLPVDSEHNAIFQCFDQATPEHVRRIILTAAAARSAPDARADGGGHAGAGGGASNWSMGAKISVDSATMMNKGLELIEAHHLFPVGARADRGPGPSAVGDPFDGGICRRVDRWPSSARPTCARRSRTRWPGRERMATPVRAARSRRRSAGSISRRRTPDASPRCALARAAIEAGGARPAVLNAANEVAVAAFLAGRIGFLDIAAIVA